MQRMHSMPSWPSERKHHMSSCLQFSPACVRHWQQDATFNYLKGHPADEVGILPNGFPKCDSTVSPAGSKYAAASSSLKPVL